MATYGFGDWLALPDAVLEALLLEAPRVRAQRMLEQAQATGAGMAGKRADAWWRATQRAARPRVVGPKLFAINGRSMDIRQWQRELGQMLGAGFRE